MQHLLATQTLNPGDHIGDHVIAYMTHVKVPRWIREHRQGVIAVAAGPIQLGWRAVLRRALPVLLPAQFEGLGLVAGGVAHGSQAGSGL